MGRLARFKPPDLLLLALRVAVLLLRAAEFFTSVAPAVRTLLAGPKAAHEGKPPVVYGTEESIPRAGPGRV